MTACPHCGYFKDDDKAWFCTCPLGQRDLEIARHKHLFIYGTAFVYRHGGVDYLLNPTEVRMEVINDDGPHLGKSPAESALETGRLIRELERTHRKSRLKHLGYEEMDESLQHIIDKELKS